MGFIVVYKDYPSPIESLLKLLSKADPTPITPHAASHSLVGVEELNMKTMQNRRDHLGTV